MPPSTTTNQLLLFPKPLLCAEVFLQRAVQLLSTPGLEPAYVVQLRRTGVEGWVASQAQRTTQDLHRQAQQA